MEDHSGFHEKPTLCKVTVSGSYIGTQTPIERLRNKLSPFITLAEILNRDKDFDVDGLVKTCNLYKNDIHTHLSDCEKFYSQNEVNGFPTKKVCFFKIEDGKYLTDNGMEITNDMLIKHSHYIGIPWNYIVLE